MNTLVTIHETGLNRFQQAIQAGPHQLIADEPTDMGGEDTGPSPFDLLMASLGACTAMTLRMYANLKKLPLASIDVSVSYEKLSIEGTQRDVFTRSITLQGDLSEADREKLLIIANKCPVHRALEGSAKIQTELTPAHTST